MLRMCVVCQAREKKEEDMSAQHNTTQHNTTQPQPVSLTGSICWSLGGGWNEGSSGSGGGGNTGASRWIMSTAPRAERVEVGLSVESPSVSIGERGAAFAVAIKARGGGPSAGGRVTPRGSQKGSCSGSGLGLGWGAACVWWLLGLVWWCSSERRERSDAALAAVSGRLSSPPQPRPCSSAAPAAPLVPSPAAAAAAASARGAWGAWGAWGGGEAGGR